MGSPPMLLQGTSAIEVAGWIKSGADRAIVDVGWVTVSGMKSSGSTQEVSTWFVIMLIASAVTRPPSAARGQRQAAGSRRLAATGR